MLHEICVEVLGSESDSDVIRLPNRNYPGIHIQGDSLIALYGAINEAIENFESDRDEAFEAMEFVREELRWRLEYYKHVLGEGGAPLS